jgi:CRISPR-associated endonuclease/helicase Cas3
VDVLLARWDGDTLHPWRGDKVRHAWAYSTVRVPRRLIDEPVMPTEPVRLAALEAAKSQMPGGGKWARVLAFDLRDGQWLADAMRQPVGGQAARITTWQYDPALGLTAVVAAKP